MVPLAKSKTGHGKTYLQVAPSQGKLEKNVERVRVSILKIEFEVIENPETVALGAPLHTAVL